MRRYIEYLNNIKINNKSNKILIMMIYDSFNKHLEESIKKNFSNNDINLVIIFNKLINIC